MKRPFIARVALVSKIAVGLIMWHCLGPLSSVMGQTVTTSITRSDLPPCPTCSGGPTAVNQIGTTYNITGGARNGPNLFHSFGEFSVAHGDTAAFQNQPSGPPVPDHNVSNIIGRVTGANPSNIYGIVNSRGGFPSSSLFLINPQGIVVGPGASFAVGGSLHLSTADYLRLGSGNDRFYADLGKTSQLTSADVSAFGFLGGSLPKPITVQSDAALNPTVGFFASDPTAPLPVTPVPHALSLVGGDVSITGRTISTNGGAVNLISVASAGEVALNTSNGAVVPPAFSGFTQFGKITLSNDASVDTSTNQSVTPTQGLNPQIAAGPIYIRSGKLELDASSLKAISRGYSLAQDPASGPDPIIDFRAGDIRIVAEQVNITNQSTIQTGSDKPPELGPVWGTFHDSSGAAKSVTPGTVDFNVGNLAINNSTIDVSSKLIEGKAGLIRIEGLTGAGSEARSVTLQSSTVRVAPGAHSAGTPPPLAGDVEIHSKDVLLDRLTYDGTVIDGAAGNFTIIGSGKIDLQNTTLNSRSASGVGGSLNFSAGEEINLVGTNLESHAILDGGAGNISLSAPLINMHGGKVSTDVSTGGFAGKTAGNIVLSAENLNIQALRTDSTIQPANISSSTVQPGGVGGSQVNSSQAGTITVQGLAGNGSVANSVVLDNSTMSTSTISPNSPSIHPASIVIRAQNIELKNGAEIRADTAGGSPAGNITLEGKDISLIQRSSIFASSTGEGKAGDVVIRGTIGDGSAASTVFMDNSTITTKTTSTSGNTSLEKGSINITTDTLNLRNTLGVELNMLLASTSGKAPAGDIILNVNTLRSNVNPDGSPVTGASYLTVNTSAGRPDDGSDPVAEGKAGDIIIRGTTGDASAARTVLLNFSQLASQTSGVNDLAGKGSINITADTLDMRGNSGGADSNVLSTKTLGPAPAGDITLNINTLRSNVNPDGSPVADAGRLFISAFSGNPGTGAAGAVTIKGPKPEATDAAQLVSLHNTQISTAVEKGRADASPGSGSIEIAADTLALTGRTAIFASAFPGAVAPAGNIHLHVNTLRANVNPDGTFITDSQNPGAVFIGSTNENESSEASRAGTVTISGVGPDSKDAANLIALNNAKITTTVRGGTLETERASIKITTNELRLTESRIAADSTGATPAGNITLNVGTLSARPGARLINVVDPILANPNGQGFDPTAPTTGNAISSSSTGSAGLAGKVLIQGPESGKAATNVSLDNSLISTTVTGGNSTSTPATIEIRAQNLALSNGTLVTADTRGATPAGDIVLNAASLTSSNGARISSSSTDNATGAAGSVTLQGAGGAGTAADSISLSDSQVTTEATQGAGGSIVFNASGPVNLVNSRVSASVLGGTATASQADIGITGGSFSMNGGSITAETNGAVPAGNIRVDVGGGLSLTNASKISSSSNGSSSTGGPSGNAGSVMLTAGGQFQASGATISSSAQDGQGGTVHLQGGNMVIDNGTTISARTEGLKTAGDINLTSNDNLFITNSTVTTSAAQASGGNIKLTAPHMVRLFGANLLSDVQGSEGSNGGNISIDPQFVVIQGNSVISASASTGAGGKIDIQASQAILQEAGFRPKATGGDPSLNGVINIQAPIQQLSGAIAPLPQAFAVATNLYGQRCAAEKGGQFSSFVQGARDGVPPQPGDLIPSPLMLELDEVPLSSSLQSTSSLSAIRLGLPGFEQTSRSSLTVFSGCRS